MKKVLLLLTLFSLGALNVRAAVETTYATSTADYTQGSSPVVMDLTWLFKLAVDGDVTNAVIVGVRNGNGTPNPSGAISLPTSVVREDTGVGYIVKKIDDCAFENQIGITALSIPTTVQEIGVDVFDGCTVLAEISVEEGNPWFSSTASGLYDKDFRKLIACPARCEVPTFPLSLTEIGTAAFADCHRLTALTLPSTVTNIAPRAFQNCSRLKSVTFAGNAPAADGSIFDNTSADLVIYRQPGTTGWDLPPWTLFNVQIQSDEPPTEVTSVSSGNVTWFYRVRNGEAEIYHDGYAAIPTATSGTYTYDAETYTWKPDNSLLIPQTLNGYPVTAIGEGAFRNCAALQNVVIPSSVRVIDDEAFAGCTGLLSLSLPNGVREIGSRPFAGSSIATVTLPDSLRYVVGNPFAGDDALLSISLGADNSYFTVRDNVLYDKDLSMVIGCPARCESVSLPDTVREIGPEAFADCFRISKLILPEALVAVGSNAFQNAVRLQSLAFPANTRWLDGPEMFSGATSLGTVKFLGNAPTVDSGLFAKSPANLTVLVAPDTTGWKDSSSTLPDQWPVGSPDARPIAINPDLKPEQTHEVGDTFVCIVTNALIKRNYTLLVLENKGVEILSVDPLPHGTFEFPSGFETAQETFITKKLGNGVLANAIGLLSVTIPNSVTDVGDAAFSNCNVLATINLNHGLRRIGAHAFAETAVETIELPDTVESINGNPLWGCRPSVSLKLNATNPFFAASEEGALYDRDFTTLHAVPMTVETLAVPATCTNFAHEAFAGCVRLKSVTFAGNAPACADGDATFADCHADLWLTVPKGNDTFGPLPGTWHGRPVSDSTAAPSRPDGTDTTVIRGITWTYESKNGLITITEGLLEQSAEVTVPPDIDGCPVVQFGDGFQVFNGCADLVTALTIPVSVTNIGNSACSDCTALSRVTLDAATNLTTVGQFAFYNCNVLDDVVLPASVRTVGDGAFCGCSSLTSVTLPDQLQTLGSSAFSSCTSLEGINLPQTLPEIRQSTFSDCSSLAEVSLPSNITSIGGSAFSWNSALKAITIPAHVGSLGSSSFSYCRSLEEVTFEGPVPNGLKNSHILDYVKNVNCPLPFEDDYRKFLPEGCTLNGASSNEDGVSTVTDDSGCAWTVTIDGADVSLGAYGETPVIPNTTAGAISVPDNVGRRPVTTIPALAFVGCEQVTKITIPASVTNIAASAFNGCTSLVEIVVAKDNPAFCAKNRCLYSKDGKTLVRVPAQTSFAAAQTQTIVGQKQDIVELIGEIDDVTGLLHPNTVIPQKTYGTATESISYAFTPAVSVEQILAGVTNIANYAFTDCGRLTEGTTVSGTLVTTTNGTVVSTQQGRFQIPFSTETAGAAATTNALTCTAGFYEDKVCFYKTIVFGALSVRIDNPLTIPASVLTVGALAFEGAHFSCVSRQNASPADPVRQADADDDYGPIEPGALAAIDLSDYAGYTATGLPSGLKWNKTTGQLTGSPKKPGVYVVTLKNRSVSKAITIRVADYPTMTVRLTQTNALTGDEDEIVSGQRILCHVGVGLNLSLTVEDDLPGVDNKVVVKGLPSGLKLVKTALRTASGTTYAYAIAGQPTRVQAARSVTITVSNKYKWSGTFDFLIETCELPAWVTGSYNGVRYDADGNCLGSATAKITSRGKLSGKILSPSADLRRGETVSISSTAFIGYDEASDTFLGTATLKLGRSVQSVPFSLFQGDNGTGALILEMSDGTTELVQSIWGRTDLTAPVYRKGTVFVTDGITVTLGTKGAVSWSGKVQGDNGAWVSVTGKAQLLNGFDVLLYAPPKTNLTGGLCRFVTFEP